MSSKSRRRPLDLLFLSGNLHAGHEPVIDAHRMLAGEPDKIRRLDEEAKRLGVIGSSTRS
jgi:hypothetical protein